MRGKRMQSTEIQDKEKQFCEELTELLIKYGFGIAGEPNIYDLLDNYVDYDRKASIDDENRLHFL
jgi:hypothetical protein